ncbi:MAG: hypothetical protein ACR2NM_02455 [Bythopirellula sp.]
MPPLAVATCRESFTGFFFYQSQGQGRFLMFTPPMLIGCGSLLLYIVLDILGCRQ